MNLLFWILWACNAFILIIALASGSFRGEMNLSTDLNMGTAVLLIITTVGSLLIRYIFKQSSGSLIVVSVPILIIFVLYLFDKAKEGRQ